MNKPVPVDIHSDAFLRSLMKRQLHLSILCAASFLIVLLGLPLANYFLPEVMGRRVLGFSFSWLVLGIGFFPAVWVISWIFIRRSIRLEEQEVREVLESSGFQRSEAQSLNETSKS